MTALKETYVQTLAHHLRLCLRPTESARNRDTAPRHATHH
jgi:hypothetical protein